MSRLSTVECPATRRKSSRAGWIVLFDRIGKKRSNKPSVLRSLAQITSGLVGIRKLFVTDNAYINFKILEKHSKFKNVFGGCSDSILDSLQDLLTWKKNLEGLRFIEVSNLDDDHLATVASGIVPPTFDYDEELDADSDLEIGSWAMGIELTVLQVNPL